MVYANPNDRPLTFEEAYDQMGYKSVKEAVEEFENHFKQDVKVPPIKPPLPFSHQFGRLNEDMEYDANDTLEISFMDDKFQKIILILMFDLYKIK